jgi:hypothetical protein
MQLQVTTTTMRQRLERAHTSISELVTLWHDAPERAQWLIMGIDGDINGALAELEALRTSTRIA